MPDNYRSAKTFLILLYIAAAVILAAKPSVTHTIYGRYAVHSMPVKEKVVALTFDDGPSPVFTREILDILDRHKAKATFFMVGKQMELYPDVVKDVIRRGHAIGNHTYTHPHNIEADSKLQMTDELEKCEQVIERMTGMRTYLYRPPRGLIDSDELSVADKGGYKIFLWSICADHHDAPTPEAMARRVIDNIKPGGIILAHDGSSGIRWKDVSATSLIIESLQKKGYRFVTLPELIKLSSTQR